MLGIQEKISKICISCKEDKLLSEFYQTKSTKQYSSYCKICDNKRKPSYKNTYTEEDKEKLRVRVNLNYLRNRITYALKDYKRSDTIRNLENDLTRDYLTKQLQQNCIYCGYPSTGLDRIDNSKGHLQNNCVPCCKECNIARMDNFTHSEMLILGKTISQIKNSR